MIGNARSLPAAALVLPAVPSAVAAFDQSVRRMVSRMRFSPAIEDGCPIAVWMPFPCGTKRSRFSRHDEDAGRSAMLRPALSFRAESGLSILLRRCSLVGQISVCSSVSSSRFELSR